MDLRPPCRAISTHGLVAISTTRHRNWEDPGLTRFDREAGNQRTALRVHAYLARNFLRIAGKIMYAMEQAMTLPSLHPASFWRNAVAASSLVLRAYRHNFLKSLSASRAPIICSGRLAICRPRRIIFL